MDVTQILMLITILVYLAAMVGIGAVLAKQNQTTDDFYLGGRTLGPLVTELVSPKQAVVKEAEAATKVAAEEAPVVEEAPVEAPEATAENAE